MAIISKIKKVFVDQLNESLNPQAGMSKPVSVVASDGKKYLLKRQFVHDSQNRLINENAVFLQELFVYQLASSLRIPVPGFAILQIDDEFINANKDYFFSKGLKPGLYFGTEILPHVENNLVNNYKLALQSHKPYVVKSWNTYFRNVINSEVYTDIIALDYLTLNGDRFSNEGNLLVASNNDNKRKVFAIDFGHCFFSPYWDTKKINLMLPVINKKNPYFHKVVVDTLLKCGKKANGFGIIFRAMEANIYFDNGNPFSKIVAKMDSLTEPILTEMMYNVPKEWFVSPDLQRKMYVQFIMENRNFVRNALDYMNSLGAFSNTLGGSLIWEQEKNYGIQ